MRPPFGTPQAPLPVAPTGAPGRQRREERIFVPQVKPAPQKFSRAPGPAGPLFAEMEPPAPFPGANNPAAYMPLLRIAVEGVPPLHSPLHGQTDAKPGRLRSAAPIRRVNRRTDTGFAPLCPHRISLTSWLFPVTSRRRGRKEGRKAGSAGPFRPFILPALLPRRAKGCLPVRRAPGPCT